VEHASGLKAHPKGVLGFAEGSEAFWRAKESF